MSSRRARAVGSSLLAAAAALIALSCHVSDVTAPVGRPNVHLEFEGDSQLIAGTRALPVVTVTSGASALAVVGLASQSDPMVRAAYLSMEILGWYVIVPFSLATLLAFLPYVVVRGPVTRLLRRVSPHRG